MSENRLTDQERTLLGQTLWLHKAARATPVDGTLRWTCDGCGQPLEPSDPAAAFVDLTVHQAVMLDDLFEAFLTARASRGGAS